MMSRWSSAFCCRGRDVEVVVFTPRRGWPGWCLGLGLNYQRSGSERQVTATLGLVEVEVLVIERKRPLAPAPGLVRG